MLAGSGLRFAKGHGTENDFVLLPDPDGELELTPALVRGLCDRRAGLGADGVLRVVLTGAVPEVAHLADQARWFMDYRNADGSLAEMCGNGIRVFARYLIAAAYARPGSLQLATRDGVRSVQLGPAGDVTVEMGRPVVSRDGVPVRLGRGSFVGSRVDLGNPHVVVVLDRSVECMDLTTTPELPPDRFPFGGNVEVVRVRAAGALSMRVHERGVGETRSCGTGACAAVAAVRATRADSRAARYDVEVPGGRLRVAVQPDGNLCLSGPAVLVAEGAVSADWLAGW